MGRATRRKRLGRQRIAMSVDGATADRHEARLKSVAKLGGDCSEHALGLADDLRANTVAGQQHEFGIHEVFLFEIESGVILPEESPEFERRVPPRKGATIRRAARLFGMIRKM